MPELTPFAEHPHLGFWVLAGVFHVFPVADWSARLPGIFFYVAWQWMFFLYLERKTDRRVAVWAVLLLCTWARFSNFFSNVYLDPGTLCFGAAAVFLADLLASDRRWAPFALAGALLSLSFMYKGLTALIFLPALAALPLFSAPENRKPYFFRLLFLGAVALVGLAIYAAILARSTQPDFLSLYWSHQMSGRFSKLWDWGALLNKRFWWELWRDTNYLAPLALVVFFRRPRAQALALPTVLFGTAVLMYAPAGRIGQQYWMMLMPWLAWAISLGVLGAIPWTANKVMRVSGALFLVAFCLAEILPVRVHGSGPSPDEIGLRQIAKQTGISELLLDETPGYFDVTTSSRYAWYSDVAVTAHVRKGEPVPASRPGVFYLQFFPSADREKEIAARGWCPKEKLKDKTLWEACRN